MSKHKSELILDTGYYSARAYVEEIEKTSLIKILMTLLLAIVIVALIFLSTSYIKNNLMTINLWLSDVKQSILPEKKEIREISEESILNKKVQPIVKREPVGIVLPIQRGIVKKETMKKETMQKEVKKILKSKPIDNNLLTDEYIKLMKKSLGNY